MGAEAALYLGLIGYSLKGLFYFLVVYSLFRVTKLLQNIADKMENQSEKKPE